MVLHVKSHLTDAGRRDPTARWSTRTDPLTVGWTCSGYRASGEVVREVASLARGPWDLLLRAPARDVTCTSRSRGVGRVRGPRPGLGRSRRRPGLEPGGWPLGAVTDRGREADCLPGGATAPTLGG